MGCAAFTEPLNAASSLLGATAQNAPSRSRFGLCGSKAPKVSRTLAEVPIAWGVCCRALLGHATTRVRYPPLKSTDVNRPASPEPMVWEPTTDRGGL